MAYVEMQPYEKLFTVRDALLYGTIFKDLYSPYKEKSDKNCKKVVYDE